MEPLINFKPEIYQEPKKLAELHPGVRNFCGDFNARNQKNEVILHPLFDDICDNPDTMHLKIVILDETHGL